MNKMFHMVFSFILKGNSEEVKKHSCKKQTFNLLIDLIKNRPLQEYLAGYNDLHWYLKEVLNLLDTSDRESTEKILELFIKLSEVECLKHVAMKAIFSDDTTSDKEKNDSSPLSTIMNIRTSEPKEEKSIHLSLKLIRNLYEIALSSDGMNVKVLLPVLANFLANDGQEEGTVSLFSSRSVEESMDAETSCLNVNMESEQSRQINSQVDTKEATEFQELVDLLENKLATIETENKSLQKLLVSKSDVAMEAENLLAQSRCKNALLEAECMKLRAMLVDNKKKIKEYENQIFIDLKEIKALNAENNSLIKDKESLESKTQKYEHMEILFEKQTAKLKELEHNYSSIEEEKANLSEINTSLKKYNEDLKAQYDCSAQKLNEMRAKLREEVKKNQELMRESQKVRQENMDMEFKLKEHFEALSKEREEVNEKLNALKNEVERLTKIAKEHEELKLLFADEEDRLERMQQNFELVTTENKTLVEMENMCRKQNEDLKNKCDRVLQQYDKSEKEKNNMIMKVKEHEKTMEASTKLISTLQEEIKLQEKKKSELTDVVEQLNSQIENCNQIQTMIHNLTK